MSETTVLRVPAMHCDHCTRAVETELRAVPGVESAEADLVSKTVAVRGSQLDHGALREAVAEAGYEVER
jgi:copper chaperone CopZ